MKKTLLGIFLLLSVMIVIFFFWASANRLDASQYAKISEYTQIADDDTASDTLSVMTYNIGYLSGMTNNLAADTDDKFYGNNLSRAIKLYAKYQPTIAGFQEIDFGASRSYDVNQLDAIGEACDYPTSAMTVNWDKNYLPFPYWPISAQYGKMLSGQAILSHYPIISNERIVMEKPASNPAYYNAFYIDRLAQVVKTKINGRELIIINTHLEAWDIPAREKQAKIVRDLYEKYTADYPVLLIGDFNSIPPVDPNPDAYYTEDRTMDIIFEGTNIAPAIADSTYLKGVSAHYTFNSVAPYQKIDYIFYNSDKITAISGEVVVEAGDISDHLPVRFEFVFKN
jgi:endonuclease/exonuclease/phosphatase family metal-dependent hydrolase